MKLHEIELLPYGKRIKGRSGRSLLEAIVDSSIFLRSDCGGRGTCGKCAVNIISASGEKESISSCNCEVKEDMKIEIPMSSLLSSHIISKAPVSFPTSFTKRKSANFEEKGFGVAVDLGTTTIAVYICNRSKGEVVSSIAVKNPQAFYGDDVMSRIGAIGEEKNNLRHLQRLVVNSIEWGILELLKDQSLAQTSITQIVAVGNPTMIHILSGVDPAPIGISPYQPAFYEARTIDSASLGFDLGNIPLHTLPQISGFIGGDILSAALATDLENQPEGTILIDLGTNGELLLKGKDKLLATSCATGPAFEGASLSCGMQAIPGAINSVEIKDAHDFAFHTIINSKKKVYPTGICGTGVISAVAELWRKGIIKPGGAFINDTSIKPLQKDSEARPQYTLVEENIKRDTASVFISQKDIRSVQLGKAALMAGIEFLVKEAGYTKPSKIIIAGAFGTFIEKEDMITIGMIPEMAPDKIEIAGNSAGAGAVMVLSDEYYYQRAIDMAEKIVTIDLATNISFQDVFVERLSFPNLPH